jgi:hypothetical protein
VEVKHTPGPWVVDTWQYPTDPKTIIQTATDAIAEVYDLWCPAERTDEKAANAQLIAAAPELLAALVEMLEAQVCSDRCALCETARTAIAKATFKSE